MEFNLDDSRAFVHFINHPAYYAGFGSKGIIRAPDMKDFGPAVKERDVLADSPPEVGKPKLVFYLPIPKRGGKEQFPSLTIGLGLCDPTKIRTKTPLPWQGLPVEIEVSNLWDEKAPRSLKLKGELRDLCCSVTIDPDTVKRWLDVGDPRRPNPFNARVNENLFDFRFRIPGIQVQGKPYTGQSENRVFFYRRKLLVFFPGVFGSQVQVKAPDGQILGFPDFVDESPHPTKMRDGLRNPYGVDVSRAARQQIGVLECDEDGQPLAQPKDPKLLMLTVPFKGPVVYDSFEKLHDARQTHFRQLPEGFRLFRLFMAPYDWRLDLTQTALEKLKGLKNIQEGEFGRRAPDSDDQLAVVGHSTGGLIIRRMLAEPGTETLISHAFFMNVPFRGAAKPLSVIPTGRDPLDGDPMIPFVDPLSLRAIALTAPIVYHLSASPAYPFPVFRVRGPGERDSPYRGLVGEKRWVELAIEKWFMPPRKVVPKGATLTSEQRRALALGADGWATRWDEHWEHLRGRLIKKWVFPGLKDDWEAHHQHPQDALRVERGWNDQLAERASQFHDKCEKMALDAKWSDRAFIFYSVSEEPTTLEVEAQLLASESFLDKIQCLKALGLSIQAVAGESPNQPPIEKGTPEKRKKMPDEEFALVEEGVWLMESWATHNEALVREKWRFATLRQIDGDGTVPLRSLLGFGGPARVFKKLVFGDQGAESSDPYSSLGPAHVDAPNHPWAWARVVEVLQGHDVTRYLADKVDTYDGEDRDKRLNELREAYYQGIL